MSIKKRIKKPLILDSALGTELENRGEYLPSFKTSIWSAHCLIHKPEVIRQIHIDILKLVLTSLQPQIIKLRQNCLYEKKLLHHMKI